MNVKTIALALMVVCSASCQLPPTRPVEEPTVENQEFEAGKKVPAPAGCIELRKRNPKADC